MAKSWPWVLHLRISLSAANPPAAISATALLLKLREDGLPQPAGLYLLSPWLDMTTTGESYQKIGTRDPILTREGIEMVAAAYLGGKPDNAFTSPVRADPAGLPPMLIQVGSEEVLLSNFADLRQSRGDGRHRGEAACLAGDAARMAAVSHADTRRPCGNRRSRRLDAATA